MPHHNYISRNIFVSILFLGIFAFSPSVVLGQEPGGACCDPDAGAFYPGATICDSLEGGSYPDNDCIEDSGCPNYNENDPCLIPISDGIPLLIIAGGVFAFYRLREKKELVVIEA
jgi:hypothetical protein